MVGWLGGLCTAGDEPPMVDAVAQRDDLAAGAPPLRVSLQLQRGTFLTSSAAVGPPPNPVVAFSCMWDSSCGCSCKRLQPPASQCTLSPRSAASSSRWVAVTDCPNLSTIHQPPLMGFKGFALISKVTRCIVNKLIVYDVLSTRTCSCEQPAGGGNCLSVKYLQPGTRVEQPARHLAFRPA